MKITTNLIHVVFVLAALLLLSTCSKPERDNPWDEKSTLNPEAWAPKNFQVEKLTITSNRLSWTYDGDNRIEGFRIDRKKGEEAWQEAYAKLPKESRSWVDEVVEPDSSLTYTYRLYAFAGERLSKDNNKSLFAAITAPSDLQIILNSLSSVTIVWVDNSIGEDGFRIERKNGLGAWMEIATTTESVFIDNYFDLNVEVFYRVCAYHSSFQSKYTVNQFNSQIPAPFNLEVSVENVSSVTLNWSYIGKQNDGFRIDRKAGNESWIIGFANIESNQREYHDNSLNLVMQGYTYRIYSVYQNHYSQDTETTIPLVPVQIGMHAFGGIVFYLDGSGGGLVCTEYDQSADAAWGCSGTNVSYTAAGIGDGVINTSNIVSECSENGIAAKICNNLEINEYSDWFLPSKGELNLMYQNLKLAGLGNFAEDPYWSSTEYDIYDSWFLWFSSGIHSYNRKYLLAHVRAVRAFHITSSIP